MAPAQPHGAPDAAEHALRASSFGASALAYAEHRPDYPAAALAWGIEPVRDRAGPRVLDLGAGTGKLTEGLLARGWPVVAVEPDAAMLAELTGRFPDARAMLGAAEDIPLPENAVDAVFVGQALHWFDLDRAGPEIRRVLRPGGVLVALWNTYDDAVPWVRGFCELADSPGRSTMDERVRELDHLGVRADADFPHRHRRTAETLVATVATQSALLIKAPADRERHLDRIRGYLRSRAETARGEFDVPIVTKVLRIEFP